MEASKAEERSAEQAATLFGTPDPENQRTNTGRDKKRSNYWKIITGVLLMCLLVVILAVVFSKKSSKDEGKVWLQGNFEEIQQVQCPPGFSRSPLILVSLDGFRAKYLKDHSIHIPVINALRNRGTTTSHMRPVYPTKTFPNHYTIVTGLYPESHGVIGNKMYDVRTNSFFSLKTDEKFSPAWYQGEPVWVTAMHQNLRTGTFFWPGSEVNFSGVLPNYFEQYDRNVPFEKRVKTLFDWLILPDGERPDFYTLYLEEPDMSGHYYGPQSEEVVEALKKVDRIMGLLMDGLKERNLHQCVNLIIVSDHGMEEGTYERAVFVSSYVNKVDDFSVIQGSPGRIRPSLLPQDYFSFDYEGLVKNLSCRTPDQPMRPYLKENLPKRMHFANNVRIERGHLYMKEGWQTALTKKELKYHKGGFHGSDNLFTNMQAIFVGYGPAFKHHTVVPPFENIELYNLMCDILGIRPSPNNGTHGSLNHLLKNPVYRPVHPAQFSHDTPCEASDPTPTNALGCTCSIQTAASEADMNRQLINTNASVKAVLRRLHHPFGTPQVVQPDVTFCLLHHTDYLSGYSRDHHMPLWVSYTMDPLTRVQSLSPDLESCVRVDVRIPPPASQTCWRPGSDPALSFGLLHPPNLHAKGPQTESLITSNMVPMFPLFKDVWTHFHDVLLPKYSQQLNGVNVISGPIFDTNYDGNVDKPKTLEANEASTPTHFFVILTSCGNLTFNPANCEGPLQAQSFILPHRPDHTESCSDGSDLTWVEGWLKFHAARVRDIELLTGLSFYHDRISVEETLQLKILLKSA